MALSKSTRILILLAIDSVFFLIELITGYAVHSLALVADAFHMLNDVISLLVGLWAVKVAQEKTSSKMYTYGWQRAETLGALVNGVFLVALCMSIFLEAIQRFVEPQEVSNPKLVLVVGCLGLLSNIVGLFLFHDHGHSHGGHGRAHGSADETTQAEEGHAGHQHSLEEEAADESGNIANVLPQSTVGNWPNSAKNKDSATSPVSEATAVERSGSLEPTKRYSSHKKNRSRSRTYSSVEDLPVNPASFRRSIIDAGRMEDIESDHSNDEDNEAVVDHSLRHQSADGSTLLGGQQRNGYGTLPQDDPALHHKHKHAQPKTGETGGGSGGHGHSHGDLNMRGVFLHVMGDALGNIGVIATALIIWLAKFSWRFYFDPLISLIITGIILASAIPLCKAASRILLQAVPLGLSIDDIKDDIESLPGVVSAHHLHVWQLSDTKLVASLHVQVAYDFKGEGSARYMQLARSIRECLHDYGIHSSTIQPEFCLDPEHDHVSIAQETDADARNAKGSKAGSSTTADPDACLLDCEDTCAGENICCPPAGGAKDKTQSHDDGHAGHSH